MDFSAAQGPGHYVLYAFSFFCLLTIFMMRIYNRSTTIINLILFATYSLIFYYKVFSKSEHAHAIIWAFLLLVLSIAHIIFSVIYLVIQFIRSQRQE